MAVEMFGRERGRDMAGECGGCFGPIEADAGEVGVGCEQPREIVRHFAGGDDGSVEAAHPLAFRQHVPQRYVPFL